MSNGISVSPIHFPGQGSSCILGTVNTIYYSSNTYYGNETMVETRMSSQDVGIYVLKGECLLNVGKVHDVCAKAGCFIGIPKLTEYSITMDAAITELLFFSTPAGPDQIVMGTSHPAIGQGPPPSDLPAIPQQRADTFHTQYDLSYIGGKNTKATQGATHLPYFRNSQTAPAYWVQPAIPELWIRLAIGSDSDNAYSLTEMLCTPGNAAAPLSYNSIDEIYYVLDGVATFLLGDHVEEVQEGDFVFIPRGTVFALRIDTAMRALVWHTPSGIIEGCLQLMLTGGQPAEENRTLPPPADLERPKVDPATFIAQAKSLGINMLAVQDPLTR